MKSYYTYILQCSDGSYYTGVTNNIERRLYEHQEGLIKGCYTHDKRPVKLVRVEEFTNVMDAIVREKQIKGWTRRKKEALIARDFEGLVKLSKSGNSTSSSNDRSTKLTPKVRDVKGSHSGDSDASPPSTGSG
ncbi:MAG: GIY-YIG nuclease family protein [Candidatus Brocadia sp.]|nr:GIY-YIG nuclease family protein [Candidatus Brocadia sp.]